MSLTVANGVMTEFKARVRSSGTTEGLIKAHSKMENITAKVNSFGRMVNYAGQDHSSMEKHTGRVNSN